MDRVIIASASSKERHGIDRMLKENGILPAGCFSAGEDVRRAVRKLGTAVVVCGFQLQDMTANDLAARLQGRAELLVLLKPVCCDCLCRRENLSSLPLPVPRMEFFDLLGRLRHREEMELRPPVMCRLEEERKIINQAKDLLIRRRNLTEKEAHRFLQRQSMKTGARIIEVARSIMQESAV